MDFVFYDTETTGKKAAFDQILQFAAIKTDNQLRELERFEIRCRLLQYVVPSPGAIKVTGITVDQLTDPALPTHYQMVQQIREKLLAWSPAIFIGHNSLGFDEHFLRQALYKSLYVPYVTNTNGNGRTNTLRMIRALARFAPNTRSIPVTDRGKPSFKLDRLAPANGFDHSAAHDAMADVEATVHLGRLIAERVSDRWSDFVHFAHKAPAMEFGRSEDVFGFADVNFGRLNSWIVTAVGSNPDNGSELLVFDLAHDPAELSALSEDDLANRLLKSPKPVRAMKCNAAPLITRCDELGDDEQFRAADLGDFKQKAAFLKNSPALRERLITAYLRARKPRQPSQHVEDQIYDGFFNDDEPLMERFQTVPWSERMSLIAELGDERLQLLGKRLIYSEAPDVMEEGIRRDYDMAIAQRLMAEQEEVPWLTLPTAIEAANDLLGEACGAEVALLSDLRDHLNDRARAASSLLS